MLFLNGKMLLKTILFRIRKYIWETPTSKVCHEPVWSFSSFEAIGVKRKYISLEDKNVCCISLNYSLLGDSRWLLPALVCLWGNSERFVICLLSPRIPLEPSGDVYV